MFVICKAPILKFSPEFIIRFSYRTNQPNIVSLLSWFFIHYESKFPHICHCLADIDNLRFEGAPPPPVANAQYGGITIPAGSDVSVRTIDSVDSERDRRGQTYRASIDQPVIVNGQTVIPRGADAVVMLSDSQQSGKIEGKAVLTLELRSITINGRTYDSTSSTVSRESGSRGSRSAKVIGGTAALGAIIGAIAGGGRGAAIGAGSGAAVGTAAQVITSGQKVKVPAETLLTFTLQNPLDL